MCLSKKLNSAALQHSQWMRKNKKFIHGSTKDLKTRLTKNKYPLNGAAAENIALNSVRSAQYTVNQWMKSPQHRQSILNRKYNQVNLFRFLLINIQNIFFFFEIGVGVDETNQKMWWTMLMAKGSDKCIIT